MSGSIYKPKVSDRVSRNLERAKLPGAPSVRSTNFQWATQGVTTGIIDFSVSDREWEYLVNAIYIDNLNNPNPVTVAVALEAGGIIPDVALNLEVQANTAQMFNVPAITPFQAFVTTSAASGNTQIALFNYPMHPFSVGLNPVISASVIVTKSSTASVIQSRQQVVSLASAFLPNLPALNGFTIRADPNNLLGLWVGGGPVTAANGFLLMPGDSISIAAANADQLSVLGQNTTDFIYIIGN